MEKNYSESSKAICDICKVELEDESSIKNLVAFETKKKNGESVGWRRILNKICCNKCYNKVVREAGASGIF